MANTKPVYATSANIYTSTLNNLANNASPSIIEVNNTSNRYLDASVRISLALASASSLYLPVWLVRGNDTGELSTGQNANMDFLGNVQANGTTTVKKTILVKDLPPYWSIFITNKTGVSLAASGNVITFRGINYELV